MTRRSGPYLLRTWLQRLCCTDHPRVAVEGEAVVVEAEKPLESHSVSSVSEDEAPSESSSSTSYTSFQSIPAMDSLTSASEGAPAQTQGGGQPGGAGPQAPSSQGIRSTSHAARLAPAAAGDSPGVRRRTSLQQASRKQTSKSSQHLVVGQGEKSDQDVPPWGWIELMKHSFVAFTQWDMVVHTSLALLLVWLAGLMGGFTILVLPWPLLYLYLVQRSQQEMRAEALKHDAMTAVDRIRSLSGAETTGWINTIMGRVWGLSAGDLAAKYGKVVAPWFLDKFKPPTLAALEIEQLHLGSHPPLVTSARVYASPINGDSVVLELGVEFFSGVDASITMNARLAGVGIWARSFVSQIQLRGTLRVGLTFSLGLPLVERVRISFPTEPYLRLAIKPLLKHNVDVGHVPLVASYVRWALSNAIHSALVEPNIVAVDVPKLLAGIGINAQEQQQQQPAWLTHFAGNPVAWVQMDVVEATNLKIADVNGTSDPYVKLQVGHAKARTSVKMRQLNPVWNESFRLPITSWRQGAILRMQVKDQDRWNRDDKIGSLKVDLSKLRDGKRHDLWLDLQEVQTGRIHLALTVFESPKTDLNGLNDEAVSVSQSKVELESVKSQWKGVKSPVARVPVDVDSVQTGAISLVGPSATTLPSHTVIPPDYMNGASEHSSDEAGQPDEAFALPGLEDSDAESEAGEPSDSIVVDEGDKEKKWFGDGEHRRKMGRSIRHTFSRLAGKGKGPSVEEEGAVAGS